MDDAPGELGGLRATRPVAAPWSRAAGDLTRAFGALLLIVLQVIVVTRIPAGWGSLVPLGGAIVLGTVVYLGVQVFSAMVAVRRGHRAYLVYDEGLLVLAREVIELRWADVRELRTDLSYGPGTILRMRLIGPDGRVLHLPGGTDARPDPFALEVVRAVREHGRPVR